MPKKRNAHRLLKRDQPLRKHSLTKKELSHRSFWVAFLVLFFVSIITILIQSEDLITGNAVFQTISFVKAGGVIDSEINVGGIKLAKIYLKTDISNSVIKYEEDSTIPFSGVFYSKVKISSADADKFQKIDLTLKIKEQDLLSLGIGRSDVAVFINNKEVPAIFTKIEDNYVYYQSTITEIEDLVIARKTLVLEKASAQKILEEEMPGSDVRLEEPIPEETTENPELVIVEVEPLPQEPNLWQKIIIFFKNIFS
ncbi:hypothetical protein HYT52_02510 [Candidatus Woesearchaeota archaeon]|nr:hypothetical protein [Candidatus Woesearchaeota archaeon]